MITALLAALLFQSAPTYTVEVMVQDKRGLFGTQTVKVSSDIPLEDGPFEVVAGGTAMLEGEISVDGDVATVDMTVCRPRISPCDVVGTPTLTFRVGDEASIRTQGFRSVYEVSFQPE